MSSQDQISNGNRAVPSGVSVPANMLRRIDEAADDLDFNRSEFIRFLFMLWEEKIHKLRELLRNHRDRIVLTIESREIEEIREST